LKNTGKAASIKSIRGRPQRKPLVEIDARDLVLAQLRVGNFGEYAAAFFEVI
jgi:hypothetical protein